jgi:GntR family transcriptional regulator
MDMTQEPIPSVNLEFATAGPLPVPLYEHVKRRISEAILMGTWPPGSLLPGEVALATQFGVAVGTVRRALGDLTAEGMLMRRRRSGTVVTGRAPQHSLRFFFQYFRLHGEDGTLLRSEPEVLVMKTTPATEAEAADLALERNAAVLRLHRLRIVMGKPVMHERMVLAAARVPDFPHPKSKVPALLYLHLLEQYGIRIAAVRERVTAVLATVEDRRLLMLRHPSAVLVIDEVAYDQAGAPTILSCHRAMTDGYVYLNEIR